MQEYRVTELLLEEPDPNAKKRTRQHGELPSPRGEGWQLDSWQYDSKAASIVAVWVRPRAEEVQ
jgi:hypothetical protein